MVLKGVFRLERTDSMGEQMMKRGNGGSLIYPVVAKQLPRQTEVSEKTCDREDGAEFARRRLQFTPDARQAEVLRSTAKRGILNCTRQWGKSTVAAAKAVHRAYSRAGSLVLVASPTERQSAEFLRKAAGMVTKL